MDWLDAVYGKNKNIRADAATSIVENPPKSTDIPDNFDSEKALKLFSAKAERAVTREAMFVLLCLQSNIENTKILSDYFIGKEYAPYGSPPVSEQSYLIFKEFLVMNDAVLDKLFDASHYVSNERIRALFVELVSDYEPYIEKLKQEFFDDTFRSRITMPNVELLLESLGEKELFDLILNITKENLDEYRYVGEKWFSINQNGGRKFFNSKHVEKHLVDICKSETSIILEHGERKPGGKYFLYGAITGLGINFGTEENMKVIFDSLLKLQKLTHGLTFHYFALGRNLKITSKIMIDELIKKRSSSEHDSICNHFCEILTNGRIHHKEYYSEDIKKLIRDISINTSNDKFESFVKYPRSYYDLHELESLVQLVAFARFGYGENMNADEINEFVENNLYECSYLLHAVQIFADDGSEIAQKWLSKDSVNKKIDLMFVEQDYAALAALLKGLESDDSFEETLDYIISESKDSINNKETALNSITYDQAYHGFGQFIVDELIVYEQNKDNSLTKLAIEASTKHIDRYTNDELSILMVSEIVSIIDEILKTNDDLDMMKFILKTVDSIRYGQPKSQLSSHLLSIWETIPKDIHYNAASCLNSLGEWNQNIENTFLDAINDHIDSPLYLYGHIHQIRNSGGSDGASDVAMNKVLDLLVNHENPVVKMFAIDCLGFRTYEPSVLHLIEILRLGSQSEKEMKLHLRDDNGRVTATFVPKPPQLAPFVTDDVYTSAIHALARLKEYSVDYLLKSLSDNDENIAIGAFLVFELHKQSFEAITFSEKHLQLMEELKKQSGI
tara:strand:+ start:163 stop:2532 length:2370 start_codon:yes stop_codon:yes gene_type:complete